MPALTVVGLGLAMVYTVVNIVRMLRGQDWNGVVTNVVAIVAGVAVAWLMSVSDFVVSLDFLGTPELTLADAKFGTIVMVGFAFASAAVLSNDVLGSIDNTRSTSKPQILSARGDGSNTFEE